MTLDRRRSPRATFRPGTPAALRPPAGFRAGLLASCWLASCLALVPAPARADEAVAGGAAPAWADEAVAGGTAPAWAHEAGAAQAATSPAGADRQVECTLREIDALVQRSFLAPRDSVPAYCLRAEELLMAASSEQADDVRLLARLALVNGRLAEFEGNAQKIVRVRRVDECCRLAIARDSTDALPFILLGALNYRLSSMSWVERTLAKAFIGDLPRTSLTDAEKLLRHAIRLQGDRPVCHYALGCTLEAMDRGAEAETALRLALAGGPQSPLDAHYQRMARERLRELENARAGERKSWQEPGEGGT